MVEIKKTKNDIESCHSCGEKGELFMVQCINGAIRRNAVYLCEKCACELGFNLSHEVTKNIPSRNSNC